MNASLRERRQNFPCITANGNPQSSALALDWNEGEIIRAYDSVGNYDTAEYTSIAKGQKNIQDPEGTIAQKGSGARIAHKATTIIRLPGLLWPGN